MFKNRQLIFSLLFVLSIVVFVILKIPALGLPYYWDELGVYSRASLYLAQNGLGLLPSNLPPELSRGHPLLFSFIYGLAYKVFGFGVYTGHILSLAVSIAMLITTYYITSKVRNHFIALLTVILLMVQPVFYAQSVFVLPEIMLALFTMWALYACHRKHIVGFAIFAGLAIMIKETAIILPAVALAYSFGLKLFVKRHDYSLSLGKVLLVISPWLLYGLFLVVQKIQNGWYFFPLHIDNVAVNAEYIYKQSHYLRRFVFFDQGRYWWVKVFIIGAIVWFLKGKMKLQPGWMLLSLLFLLAFSCFSSVNFYMDRYMLSMLPLLCWIVIECINVLWNNKVFVSAITTLLIFAALHDINPPGFHYDTDMSYTRMLDVQQQAVTYICEKLAGTGKFTINFPLNYAVSEPHAGYKKKCTVYGEFYNAKLPTEYVAYGNDSYDFEFEYWAYDQIAEFRNGHAWVVVFKRKQQ